VQSSLYIRAAKCQSVERIPIWLMRQAGRSMKAYRSLREKYSMKNLLTTPELACEVTLQPIRTYGMDAAILFSDILTIPDALGLGVEYPESRGPVITHPIQNKKDVDSLNISNIPEKLDYVMQAIQRVKKELSQVPLIGFSGAPFTLASYMIGDGQGHDLGKFMQFVFQHQALIHDVLDKLAQAVTYYLNAQIKAGVDAIQIFDSWSSVLSWAYFKELALPYLKKVIQNLDNPNHVPITVFGTGHSVFYPLLQDIGAQVISLDSKADIALVRKAVLPHIALQGNLDPHLLLAPRDVLKKQTENLLESMQHSQGYIFNLGHGVLPNVSEDNVKFLVDLVKGFK
jgi:uroporphyrinogen decarboxylase